MYEKLLPRDIITAKNIDDLLKTGKSSQSITSGNSQLTLEDIVDEAFATTLFNKEAGTRTYPKLNGLQLINREVIVKYLRQLLRIDQRSAPLRVLAHEFDVNRSITIKVGDTEKELRVGGRVDRLDEVFSDSDKAQLRVVDYKTGGRVAAPLKSIDEVFDPKNVAFKKSDYTMQAMFYSLIEAEYDDKLNPLHHAVSPALLFIQHAGGDDYSPILSMEGKEITDVTEYKEPFFEHLIQQLEDLFNRNIAFSPTDDLNACSYCPYKQMCGR